MGLWDKAATIGGRVLGGARVVPRAARIAAPAAGLVGAGWLVSRSLAGNNTQSNAGDSGGSATSMGGGGLSGGRAGLASSRGFTAPNNDNSPRKVSYNPNGNFETESLRLQASSANSLASIDNTVRNMLKFSVAKATWDTRSLREMSIESSNNGAGGLSGGAGGSGMINAVNGNQQGGISPLLVLGLTAAAGALLVGINTFGKFFGGGGSDASAAASGVAPTGSQGSLGSPAGSMLQQIGVAGTSAAYSNDASNRIRATPVRPAGPTGPIAANDNGIRRPSLSMAASQGRLGSALGSGAGRGVMKVFRFLKGLRATPVGRFPILTSVFALIDPLEATIMSGGAVNDSVKRELIGAIAMIIAGPAGVAMGAAVGAAIAIPATPVGMAVGAILGGLGGAIAALSAEFVAEQIYDLIAGNITLSEFARKLGRGAMNGLRNSAALAGGAILGGALAGVGMARRAAGAIAPVVAETGGTVARAGMRMPARVAVGAAVVAGGAATYHMTRPNAPAVGVPALMQMQGSELHAAARLKAEQYLGRSMTGVEWDALLRTVYAESGRGAAGREDAMILATILNRARAAGSYSSGAVAQGYLRQGLTVLAVLFAQNQFQAVTGTTGNRRPSAHWTRGPNHNEVEGIFRAILQYLDRVPHTQVAFTAASAAAYGAGTNISYRDTMLRNGGQTVGRTVFNTALLDQARPQNMAPAAAPVVAAGAGAAAPRMGGGPQNNAAIARVGPAAAGAGARGPRTASGIPLATITTSRLGLTAQVNAAYAPRFQSFINELEATGYVIRSIGGYANRRTAKGGFSHHANGDSIDINPAQNPHVFNRPGITDMPIEQTRAAAQRNGLGWGFDWRSSKDAMHFSVGRNEGGTGGANDDGSAGHAGHAGHGAGAAGAAAGAAGAAAAAPRRAPTITWGNLRPTGGSSAASPAPRMAPATPTNRLATNIVAASVAAERKNINVVVQNAQTQETIKTASRTQKTDTSAAESVSSPVMAAYEYAAYWGVD